MSPEAVQNLTITDADGEIIVVWVDSANSDEFNLTYLVVWHAMARGVTISIENRTLESSIRMYNITEEFVQDGVTVNVSVQACNDFGAGPPLEMVIVLPGGKWIVYLMFQGDSVFYTYESMPFLYRFCPCTCEFHCRGCDINFTVVILECLISRSSSRPVCATVQCNKTIWSISQCIPVHANAQ